MAAYLIVDIEVTDPEAYDVYRKLVPDTIALYGGKYLTRGGRTEVLEGDWIPNRFVIVEFESIERAKQWLNSPEYKHARTIRQRSAHTNMIVAEGL